jgi:hypothetical protein
MTTTASDDSARQRAFEPQTAQQRKSPSTAAAQNPHPLSLPRLRGREGWENEAQTRVQRFLRRIDDYLAALDDDAGRRSFLDRQVADWEARYSRFLATDGACEPVRDGADPVQAADFLLTIAALTRRRSALRGEHRMAPTKRHTQAHRAMLSLLVTADQRCPAIIGQAHLLYHADDESCRFDPAQAVAQLKRDAEDLLKAITAAEVALRTASPPAASGTAL